jgi:FkbM family methyltransferase
LPTINTTFIRQVGPLKWARRYARRAFDKRVLHRDSRLRLPTGLTINLPCQSASATEVFVTNADIDWGAEALFAKVADPHRDFLDVGAHIGYYSMYLSPLVRTAYAFEPDPRNISDLKSNASRSRNIEVVPVAISSRTGVGCLRVARSSSLSSLEGADCDGLEVALTTIDDFIAARPGIDAALIKTDIEGHDLAALQGMTRTVARCQPLILTECNRIELWSLCEEWSYCIFAFTCDRATLKMAFRRMSREDARNRWYKMLFLVPRRLERPFEDLGDQALHLL